MKTNKRTDVAEDLAIILGIDLSGHNVTGFNVRARAGQTTTVTVTHRLKDVKGIGVQMFTLEPMDLTAATKPYDVNCACMTAELRLQRFINERAAYHRKEMAKGQWDRWPWTPHQVGGA